MLKRARVRGLRAVIRPLLGLPWEARRFDLFPKEQLLRYSAGEVVKDTISLKDSNVSARECSIEYADNRTFSFGLFDSSDNSEIILISANSIDECRDWVQALNQVANM